MRADGGSVQETAACGHPPPSILVLFVSPDTDVTKGVSTAVTSPVNTCLTNGLSRPKTELTFLETSAQET